MTKAFSAQPQPLKSYFHFEDTSIYTGKTCLEKSSTKSITTEHFQNKQKLSAELLWNDVTCLSRHVMISIFNENKDKKINIIHLPLSRKNNSKV